MEGREVEIESMYGVDDDDIWRSKADGRIGFAKKSRFIPSEPVLKGRPWADYEDEELENASPAYTLVDRKEMVHVPKREKKQHGAEKLLDMETINRLGYDPSKFRYPEVSMDTERISLKKHLELFHRRTEAVSRKLTPKQIARVVSLCLKKLDALKFMPAEDYKTERHIKTIIDSTRVKDCKSSGHPWVSVNRWPVKCLNLLFGCNPRSNRNVFILLLLAVYVFTRFRSRVVPIAEDTKVPRMLRSTPVS
jgi:hypothetical protein